MQERLANADTGTTGHYVATKDLEGIEDIREDQNGITVELPNGVKIKSTKIGRLKFKWLDDQYRIAHIFPQLTGSLISIGMFCDAGLKVVFDRTSVEVLKEGNTVITGKRINKLWFIDLSESVEEKEVVIQKLTAGQMIQHSTQAEIIQYAHLCMSATPYPTFLTAITRGYIKPPGVNVQNIRRNVPVSVATAKGHLNMHKQNLRSTKSEQDAEEQAQVVFNFPKKLTVENPKNLVFAVKICPIESMSADLAGRFPVISKRGKQYHMVLYCAEINYIHIELLSNRSGGEIGRGYENTFALLNNKGYNISFMHCDNETSDAVKKFFKDKHITVQFVPPGNHRTLVAERAIQTWKCHFISTLCCADENFLMSDADQLVSHAEMTLILLRASAINPTISAYHQLHGPFD